MGRVRQGRPLLLLAPSGTFKGQGMQPEIALGLSNAFQHGFSAGVAFAVFVAGVYAFIRSRLDP